ncbi:MAG TPA: outer membrane lipoprotein carrier protein LolA [Opitutaceae bacterium]|nr:outer membrane lipoprotein carrier protein LolA [Opitutaceae bacterium]
MILRHLITGSLLCGLVSLSVPQVRGALPADIVKPEYRLELSREIEWQTLFQQFAAQGSVLSAFEELRYLPIRKRPIVLTGEMRLSPERGLSLHYLTPEENRIIIDDQGILVRDAQGRSRDVGNDPRAKGATRSLLQVLRFDLATLERDFILYGAREGHAWQVVLDPKPEAVVRDASLGQIVVRGQDQTLLMIELRRSEKQRIEILVGKTETGVTFSAEDLATYFR